MGYSVDLSVLSGTLSDKAMSHKNTIYKNDRLVKIEYAVT